MNKSLFAAVLGAILTALPIANAQSVRLQRALAPAAVIEKNSDTEIDRRILTRYNQLWNMYRVRTENSMRDNLAPLQAELADARTVANDLQLKAARAHKAALADHKASGQKAQTFVEVPSVKEAFEAMAAVDAKARIYQAKADEMTLKQAALDRLVPSYQTAILDIDAMKVPQAEKERLRKEQAQAASLPKTALEGISANMPTNEVRAAVKADSARLLKLLRADTSATGKKHLTYLKTMIKGVDSSNLYAGSKAKFKKEFGDVQGIETSGDAIQAAAGAPVSR